MKYPKKPIILSVMLLGLIIFTISGEVVSAQEMTTLSSQSYSFAIGRECTSPARANIKAEITNGSVSVLHSVNPGTISGTNMVQVGERWTFTNNPYDPVFNANDGSWDTPIGSFCNTIDDPCFDEQNIIAQETTDENSIGSWKIFGQDSREGYVYWTAVKPDFTVQSLSPSVISCVGKECTAEPGSEGQQANVIVEIAPTPARIWAFIFADRARILNNELDREDWFWASGKDFSMLFPFAPFPDAVCSGAAGLVNKAHLGKSSMDLPARDITFSFNVEAPEGGGGGGPPSIDLEVDGGDHEINDPLIKNAGDLVDFTWESDQMNECWAWGDDGAWQDDPIVIPNGSRTNHILPNVAIVTTIEYKISCNDNVVQNGFWSRILSMFGFIKKVFARAFGGEWNDSVFITVNPLPSTNLPPSANAGPSHSTTDGVSHTHSGASASDPDANLSSYEWEFVSCPSSCPTLSGDSGGLSGGSASISGPIYTPNAIGNYVLRLKVTDADGATDTDTVTETAVCPGCPAASLRASPPLITRGQSSNLIWSCQNSSEAKIDDENGNVVLAPTACAGSCSNPPTPRVSPANTTKYTLTCTEGGTGAIATDEVFLQVGTIKED